jgi:hypothetical protein
MSGSNSFISSSVKERELRSVMPGQVAINSRPKTPRSLSITESQIVITCYDHDCY